MLYIVLMALTIVVFVGALIIRGASRGGEGHTGATVTAFVAVAFAIGVTLFNIFVVIPAGSVGVGTVFGKPQDKIYTEGLNIVHPLVDMHRMQYRTLSYQIQGPHSADDKSHPEKGGGAVNILTKDQLRVFTDVTVNYALNTEDAVFVFRFFGENYEETLIKNPAHAAIRDAAQVYTFEEIAGGKREQVADDMKKHLEGYAKELIKQRDPSGKRVGMFVQQVFLKRVTPPPQLVAAIEAKLVADQQAKQMEFTLAKEKQEALRKEIEARGIQKFQEIVSKGIDDRFIMWKAIGATERLAESDNTKVIVIGSGSHGLPLMLGNLMDQLETARKAKQ